MAATRTVVATAALALALADPVGAGSAPAAPSARPDARPAAPVPLGPPEIHLRVGAAAGAAADATPLDMKLRNQPGFLEANRQPVCGTTRDLSLAAKAMAARENAALQHARQSCAGATGNAPSGILGPPNIFLADNIIVMENDGLMIVGDRPPDLQGKSAHFVPSGSGFSATLMPSNYVAPVTTPVFQDETGGFKSYPLTLPFAFPFGGTSYTDLWMTNTGGLFFTAPVAPSTQQVNEAATLYDRSPRITALRGGTSYYGYTGYYSTNATPAYAVFTWATPAVEIQITLEATGEMTLTWNLLSALHGTASVVTGNDAFWASEVEVAAWTDPLGDANGFPAPDGLAVDVVGVHVREIPGTGVTRIVLDLAGPLPTSGGNTFYYDLQFYPDTGSGTQVGGEFAQIRDGVQNGGGAAAVIVGSTLELGVPSWRFGVGTPSFDLRINTWWNNGGWQYADGIASPGVTLPALYPPLQLDFSTDLPKTTNAPFYECFTIGSLNTYAVYDAYNRAFGSPFIDSMPIFQNIYTDIIFFAGAYSTVGNPAAAGIGVGNPADPPYPALLHMNTIGYGWNSWEGGRTTVLNQEFGHHYAYFARFKEGGVTSTNLNPDGAHPAGWVHTSSLADVFVAPDFSSFGGSFWTDHLDGSYTSSAAGSGTSLWPVELYLMGLIGPSEVPDWWYLSNPDQPIAQAYWPAANQTVRATKVPATIQQIIDENGPRDPAYPMADRDFATPFVLVVRPGSYDPSHSATVSSYCTEWERNFNTGSWGRGTVSCFTSCVAVGASVGNTLLAVKGPTPGNIQFTWTDLSSPGVANYPIFEDAARNGTFTSEVGVGTSGVTGASVTPSAGSPLYYRVAGRNPPDCVGPK